MVPTQTYVNLTQANFEQEVLASSQPVLVDFWAEWCGPCHMVAPVIEELADDFQGRARIAKLNIDQSQEIARTYDVRSIPTLLFFKNGQVTEKTIGVTSKQAISEKLEALIDN